MYRSCTNGGGSRNTKLNGAPYAADVARVDRACGVGNCDVNAVNTADDGDIGRDNGDVVGTNCDSACFDGSNQPSSP